MDGDLNRLCHETLGVTCYARHYQSGISAGPRMWKWVDKHYCDLLECFWIINRRAFAWPSMELFSLLDSTLGREFTHTVKAFLVFQMLWAIWLGRNEQTFNPRRRRAFDLNLVLLEDVDHLHVLCSGSPPGKKHTQLLLC